MHELAKLLCLTPEANKLLMEWLGQKAYRLHLELPHKNRQIVWDILELLKED